MSPKFWLLSGVVVILASFAAAVYYANQIMNQMVKAQAEGSPAPNIDLNEAVYAAFFVGVGFIIVIIGAIKHLNSKKVANQ